MNQGKLNRFAICAIMVSMLCSAYTAQAQYVGRIQMDDKKAEDWSCRYYENNCSNLKNIETTYFVAYNVNSPSVKKYLEVLKANWKISKNIELISFDQVKAKMASNAVFIAPTVYLGDARVLGYSIMSFPPYAVNNADKMVKEADGNLNFYGAMTHKKFMIEQPWELAKAQKNGEKLKTLLSEEKTSMYKSLTGTNYSPFEMEESKFLAWNEDVFKQQLLSFQWYVDTYVKTDKEKEASNAMKNLINSSETDKLKTETLYVPDYTLAQQAKSNEPLDVQKAMGPYPFPWKKITNADFKKKLKSGERFYYVHMDRLFDVQWLFEVINAKTGEIIYTRYYCCDMAMSPGMIKNLKADTSK